MTVAPVVLVRHSARCVSPHPRRLAPAAPNPQEPREPPCGALAFRRHRANLGRAMGATVNPGGKRRATLGGAPPHRPDFSPQPEPRKGA